MSARHQGVRGALLAIAMLLAGLAGGIAWPALRVPFAGGGFVGFVWWSSRVLRDLDADPLVFEPRTRDERRRAADAAVRAGLTAGTIGALITGRSAFVSRSRERRRRPRPGWAGLPHTAATKPH